jgi:hypothetical protein
VASAVVVVNAVPFVGTKYHLIPVPVEVRDATVGKELLQKACEVEPVGADGFWVTVTVVDAGVDGPLHPFAVTLTVAVP